MAGVELKSVNICDGLSLFEVAERLSEEHSVGRPALDYGVLHEVLEELRADAGWKPSQQSFLQLSYDPRLADDPRKASGQQRFLEAIGRTQFKVDPIDFRSLYVSVAPGIDPKQLNVRPVQSIASRLAYTVGRLARHKDAQVLIVTHGYELAYPLIQMKRAAPGARVALAHFEAYIDRRWMHAREELQAEGVELFYMDDFIDELFNLNIHTEPEPPRRERTPEGADGLGAL